MGREYSGETLQGDWSINGVRIFFVRSPGMKRAALIVAATLAASMFAGCASNNSDPYSNTTGPVRGGKVLGGIADPPPMSVRNEAEAMPEKEPTIAAQTFFAAGQFAEAEGNFPVAAQQYEKACKAQPDYLWAQYRLGVVYSHMKNWPKAVEAWNAYIESTNGTASAWSNLGFTWELAGDSSRAEEAYKKGIAKDPQQSAGAGELWAHAGPAQSRSRGGGAVRRVFDAGGGALQPRERLRAAGPPQAGALGV
jgi:tetratricopeptide (TPR) repeat protein